MCDQTIELTLRDIIRFAVQNFDVVRCVNVQPVSLCGRIIPFCTMNSIHRPKIEERLGVSVGEWRRKHKAEIGAVA